MHRRRGTPTCGGAVVVPVPTRCIRCRCRRALPAIDARDGALHLVGPQRSHGPTTRAARTRADPGVVRARHRPSPLGQGRARRPARGAGPPPDRVHPARLGLPSRLVDEIRRPPLGAVGGAMDVAARRGERRRGLRRQLVPLGRCRRSSCPTVSTSRVGYRSTTKSTSRRAGVWVSIATCRWQCASGGWPGRKDRSTWCAAGTTYARGYLAPCWRSSATARTAASITATAGKGVHVVGETSDVQHWYDAADVAVQPSRWEGMSYATIEAMASGLPVVAFDVGGMRQALGVGDHLLAPTDYDGLFQRVAACSLTRTTSRPRSSQPRSCRCLVRREAAPRRDRSRGEVPCLIGRGSYRTGRRTPTAPRAAASPCCSAWRSWRGTATFLRWCG